MKIMKISIGKRMVCSFLLVGLLPLIILGYLNHINSVEIIKASVESNLESICERKARHINAYFLARRNDVSELAQNPFLVDASVDLIKAFTSSGVDSAEYAALDSKIRPYLIRCMELQESYDMFIVSLAGDVVFSLGHESDFEGNLKTGPCEKSELANVFNEAIASCGSSISDFRYYEPSGQPAAFVGAPVYKDGRIIAVLAAQMDTKAIYEMLKERKGLGRTGETIVASRIGNQAIFLNPLRSDPHAAYNRTIDIGSSESMSIQQAVQGKRGVGLCVDYRGKTIVAAWEYLPHLRIGMVVKQDIEEIYAPVYALRKRSLIVYLFSILFLIAAALMISRRISAPVKSLNKSTTLMAAGDLTVRSNVCRTDEIGGLALSFNQMAINLETANRKLTDYRDHLEDLVEERTTSLREREQMLSSIYASIPLMTVLIDKNAKLRMINATGALTIGREVDDLIGLRIGDALHCVNHQESPEGCGFGSACSTCPVHQSVMRTLHTGEQQNSVDAMLRLDRDDKVLDLVFLLSTTRVLIEGEHMVLATFLDVTAGRLAEEQRQALSARNEAMLGSIPDIIMEVDEKKVYTWCNDAGRQFFGEDVIGKEAAHYFEAEQTTYDIVQPVFAGQEDAIYVESWQRRKDGEKRLLAWWCKVLKDRDGNVTGALSTARDITERMRTEGRFKVLFDSSRDAVMLLEPPSWKFTSGNAATIKMFDARNEADLTSRAPWEFSPEYQADGASSKDKAREMIETAIKKGSHFFEWTHKRLNGEHFPATVLLSRITLGGKIMLQATVRDITESITQEIRIRQAQKLQAVATLAAGVAHDFNNVLMPIAGFSEILLSDPDALDDRQETIHMLEMIKSASDDARHIVRRLREIYKEGKMEYQMVELAKVMESVVSITMPKWKAERSSEGVTIEISTKFEDVPMIKGNTSELREAFTNVVLNAVDAMPDGGTITLSLELQDGKGVVSEVRDTGMGMDENSVNRCMEPFFTTKGLQGSGLGLMMVHGIVKRHGGGVEINSEPGAGTTVRMHFPVPVEIECAEDEPAVEPEPIPPIRVLVIDDEARSLNLVARFLQADGHAVEMAPGGQEGLELFRRGEFDLVITDRAMPLMGGDEVAAEIAKHRPETLVIMLTGFGDIMKDKGWLPQGVTRIMSKPATSKELRHVMADVMRNAGRL